jgi:hypoxanthine-guanine phosphoribosyltransferase
LTSPSPAGNDTDVLPRPYISADVIAARVEQLGGEVAHAIPSGDLVVVGVLVAVGPLLGAQVLRFTQALFLAIPSLR